MIRRDGYEFRKSTRDHKKYDVYKNGKYLVSFGDNRYQQYKDKLMLYRHLDHGDEQRRKLYRARHGTNPEFESAGWFALNYLW